MRSRESLASAVDFLQSCGIEHASTEARLLLSHVLDVPPEKFLTDDPAMDDSQTRQFNRWVARRGENREPLAYILGTAGFYGLELEVSSAVLIPRPSTESLVERAIDVPAKRAADIGTGCGAIAVALARHREDLRLIATDLFEPALTLARRNAANAEVDDRIEFRKGSLLEPIEKPVDLLISNPPYVRSDELPKLQPEVRHEPPTALDGGPDGLDQLRPLIAGAQSKLADGGTLLLEFGHDQADAVRDLARAAGFSRIEIHKDLDGINRILEAGTSRSSSPKAGVI